MTNNRATWTAYLDTFNNCNATYSSRAGCWVVKATPFAVDGITREGFFTVVPLTPANNLYYAKRTNKARQG